MKDPANNAPVFAIDETTDWEDLENIMSASVEYQLSKLGKIIPLMFFAPMTEPQNLDAWEPMTTLPQNLFIVSIERSTDATLIHACTRAGAELGELRFSVSCPSVRIDFDQPLADVFRQMKAADISAFASPHAGADAPSFFFVSGPDAVRAFDRGLRAVTASRPTGGPGSGA